MIRLIPLVLLLAACSPEEPSTGNPKEETAPAPAPPSDLIAFKVPEGWVAETPSNNMRKAQYRVSDKEKEAADAVLTLFRFRIASPVSENIKRWATQMGGAEPKQETFEGKAKVTFADMEGTYAGDFGGSPIPNARMLAAIVEKGGEQWFFKLVGPAATVGDWREEYVAMLKGAGDE